MALKVQVKGRAELNKRLEAMAPAANQYAAAAKLAVVQELAEKIRPGAPRGATLEYAEEIEGDVIRNRPHQELVGIAPSKDPDAAGLFAPFIFRFLEFGTAPHNTAKGGGTISGKKQAAAGGGNLHPGTKAQPHIFHVWRAMRASAKRRVNAAINKGVREAMGKK